VLLGSGVMAAVDEIISNLARGWLTPMGRIGGRRVPNHVRRLVLTARVKPSAKAMRRGL
jgi:hypothetical protein